MSGFWMQRLRRPMSGCRNFLTVEVPYVWLNEYIAMPHQRDVPRIPVEGFVYVWDMSSELVRQRTEGGLCSSRQLVFRPFGVPLGAGELRTDCPGELSKWATAGIRPASVASGLDLLVCSHIGLRCL
jgi:hypothetical protein